MDRGQGLSAVGPSQQKPLNNDSSHSEKSFSATHFNKKNHDKLKRGVFSLKPLLKKQPFARAPLSRAPTVPSSGLRNNFSSEEVGFMSTISEHSTVSENSTDSEHSSIYDSAKPLSSVDSSQQLRTKTAAKIVVEHQVESKLNSKEVPHHHEEDKVLAFCVERLGAKLFQQSLERRK